MARQESITQLFEALRDNLVDAWIDQTYQETFLLGWVTRNSKDCSGRTIDIRYRTGRNWASGARAERELLPVASARSAEKTTIKPKWCYYPIDLTGQEIRQAKGDKGALIDLLSDAFEDRLITAKFDLERQLWGDGSGRIARVNGAPVTADAGAHTLIPDIDEGVIHMFKEGMVLDFYTAGGAAHNLGIEVIDVDISNNTILLDLAFASSTILDDDYIYIQGNYIATLDKEITGLQAHISDTNPPSGYYQSVDRTALPYKFLKAQVLHNSGTPRAISYQLLRFMVQESKKRGGMLTRLVTSYGVRNSFILLLESLNQPPMEIVEKAGSRAEVKFAFDGHIMMIEDSMLAPLYKIWGISGDDFEFREFNPLEWDTLGGDKLNNTQNYDVQWGRMIWGGDLVCINPKANVLLADIKENDIT